MPPRGQRVQPPDDRDADHGGEADEEPALPAACLRKQAECGALVVQARDVEEWSRWQDLVQRELIDDEPFGELVERDHECREPDPDERGPLRDVQADHA
jgi:hypothetical protein